MRLGYVVVSNEIMLLRKPIGYFYREETDDKEDSGWRFFSGQETEDYMGDPKNFALYNASTIVEIDSSVTEFLAIDPPVAFERDEVSGRFVEIKE